MDLMTLKQLKPSVWEEAIHGYRSTGDMTAKTKDHLERVVLAGIRKSCVARPPTPPSRS